MSIHRYPVKKQWIEGIPSNPYRNGVGAYEGVVLHYTDNENDTAQKEADYAKENWEQRHVFVHEFVDAKECIQTANPDYKAAGAGRNANERFTHIELCHANNKKEFEDSFDKQMERAAEYLANRKLGVTPAKPDGSGTLWSHADVTHYLGGTDHLDPEPYLKKWGKTWQDAIDQVAYYYDQLI